MQFSTISFEDYPRQELRDHLLGMRAQTGSPMPLSAIDEIVDLACHAAERSRSAALEVLDRASDPRISNTAIGLAFSLIASDCKTIEAALRLYASETGKPLFVGSIGGQAHG